MRLWLVWAALTKRYFVCVGYNKAVKQGLLSKGAFAFSHLPQDVDIQLRTWEAVKKFADRMIEDTKKERS